jgi:predicted metalloprotease with PDZ domain
MRGSKTVLFAAALLGGWIGTAAGTIPEPRDVPCPGTLRVTVDASDLDRKVVHVTETLTSPATDTVLLYPKWLPGTHAPEGPIDRVAGIVVRAGAQTLAWSRDPLDPYALHVAVPAGTAAIDIAFDYLSPTSSRTGTQEISRDLMFLEWNALVWYPAGYYARQIAVEPSLVLPGGWGFGTALERTGTDGRRVAFARTDLETLVDSPVYAGRYSRVIDLDPSGKVPVRLNVFADRPSQLEISESDLKAHRAVVQQAYRLYGSHHYAHYDFLLSLSEQIAQNGLEHHQSSEDGADPSYFTDRDANVDGRDLLTHEYTHSWNGKFRRPADLWTPNYNVPMQDSLLWVYEGQTQYWGEVLAARSGLWTASETRDALALTAAYYDAEAGRQWRPLADTTNDEIMNPRRPQSWTSWQRFEDYYSEAQLIWLEADTLIRERSKGKRSLDDFARRFFGVEDGRVAPLTYTFEDVVATLNAVEPYDWATFLHERVDRAGAPAPLAGIVRGGYRLVYDDTPNAFLKVADKQKERTSFAHSIGITIAERDGAITDVRWGSAAFRAGLTEGTVILAVDGTAYSGELMAEVIKNAKGGTQPIELLVRSGDHFRTVSIDYHEGLRYPHLVRDPNVPARLDDILAPRN